MSAIRQVSGRVVGVIKGWSDNAGYQVGNPAAMLRVATTPVAPVAEYDEWLTSALSADSRAKPKVTGAKLHRAVQLIRNGHSIASAERAVGSKLRKWLLALPPHLAA